MSQTIAHRPRVHVHIPMVPVVALIVAIIVAAAVLILVNQPTTTTTEATVGTTSAAYSGAASFPETSLSQLHHLQLIKQAAAAQTLRSMTAAELRAMHNRPESSAPGFSSVSEIQTPPSTEAGYGLHRATFPGPR